MLPEGDTMNYAYYEGKGTDVKQVIDLAETLPFFAPRRLIVMEARGFSKSASPELSEYIRSMPETACFLFCRERGGQAWQALQSSERKRPDCGNDKAGRRYPAEWVLSMIQKEGKQITQSAVRFFLTKVGDGYGEYSRRAGETFLLHDGKDRDYYSRYGGDLYDTH